MTSSTPRRWAAAAAGLGLVAAPLTVTVASAGPAQAADPVSINVLSMNDFHGRIDTNTTAWATTVEQLRATAGDDHTVLVSAGDNVGASLFASASAQDNPTIDVLNAIALDASAVGNHEFDQGFADLQDHIRPRADWDYLGANVYHAGTEDAALPEYSIQTVQGVDVGVIGAVTQETPSLVSPAGIADLDFGDPVAAVNRVAAQLSDGNPDNGEADVLVATFHEGATEGEPSTLQAEVARGGAFADIVTDLDPDIDVILNGHTHQVYAWDAPLPGGGTRPVLQTGSYGDNVGQVELSVDPASGDVLDYTARNVPRAAAEDLSLPRVAAVEQIVDDALATADVVGQQQVATVTRDVTTAYDSGHFSRGRWVGPDRSDPTAGRDERGSESALGNLVADALLDSLAPADRGGAEISFVNPGGLRSELFAAPTAGNATDSRGEVQYAEANAVLPFVNNLWTLDLTGRQVKAVLEEQWQPAGSSRPFLHLGLSDNVRTTLDPSQPVGHRVTSVRVDGKPLDLDRTYRVGTFSFLATGGDNFTTFAEGTNVSDSGLIDRDAWIAYLGAHSPVTPEFDRHQVYATGVPGVLTAGDRVSMDLSRIELTSVGTRRAHVVAVSLRRADGIGSSHFLRSFPVTDSAASVDLTVPARFRGQWELTARVWPGLTLVGPSVKHRPAT